MQKPKNHYLLFTRDPDLPGNGVSMSMFGNQQKLALEIHRVQQAGYEYANTVIHGGKLMELQLSTLEWRNAKGVPISGPTIP